MIGEEEGEEEEKEDRDGQKNENPHLRGGGKKNILFGVLRWDNIYMCIIPQTDFPQTDLLCRGSGGLKGQ